MLEFAILGPLEVRADGQSVELPGSASRRVLAALVVGYGDWMSAGRLIDEVWGELPPASARKALQMHVWRLRRALAVAVADPQRVLASGPAGYRLDVAGGQVDAVRFEQLVKAAGSALASSQPEKGRELLVEALGVWRGPPLSELSLAGETAAEIGRLEELRLAALEQRIEVDLQLGRHVDVIGELRRLVTEHPWRERLHAQLMVAHYRAGRQVDALAAYRTARTALIEQLGIEPGPELKRLEREILEHAPALRQPRRASRARLPVAPNPTLGRERDVAATAALVRRADVRLLTLVGPGGVGKTRLALELSRKLADEFPDGARFVALASTAQARHVPAAIGHALGVSSLSGETPEQALARFLAPKQLLLVLDNLEHLLEAAPIIGELLAKAEGLVVLATAREPLRLQAETRYQVAPLKSAAASALFCDRVRRQDAQIALEPTAIERICERLDRLPLAIELAAPRVALLGPNELERRLDGASLGLGTGARDAPARQQTLRATVDWSFQLLAEPEQEAFVGLAVFAGGCTIGAAESVTGASLDTLESLVTKSLLMHSSTDGGEPRLLMLETVRHYAAERLAHRDDADALRRRHLQHYLGLAERSEPELRGAGRETWLPRLDAELDNLRGGLSWALDRDKAELALALAGALGEYWWARNAWSEGLRWLRAALDAAGQGTPPHLRARAVLAEALLLLLAADYESAARAADQSLRLYRGIGDAGGIAQSLTVMTGAELHLGQRARAGRLAEEALLSARSVGDDFLVAVALKWKAAAATSFRQARPLMREAVAILRRLGSTRRAATLLSDVAYVALVERQYGEARALLAEALALARTINDPAPLATIRGNQGLVELFAGEPEAATAAFREELELTRDGVFPRLAAEALLGMAALAARNGRLGHAARLTGASLALSLPWPPEPLEQRTHDEILAPARDQHGHAAWDDALKEGEQMAFQAAIGYALTHGPSGLPAEA